jgi:hypothetical protein
VNNSLAGSYTNSGGVGSYTTTAFAIATYDTSTPSAFNGTVDDLRIYNSAVPYVPISMVNVTGSLSYVPGIVGPNAVNIANTAGGTATNYIRGSWSLPSNFTISFWVNQQSSSTTQPQMIFGSAGGTVAILFNTSNQMYANFLTGGGTNYTAITTSFTFSSNTWYHIYYLFQAGGMCALYVNGVSAGSFTNTSGIGTQTTTAFGLGTYEVTSNNIALNGYIDDFRIYHAAIPIHVLLPQNYRSLALSGTGQYALASAASGWVVGSSDLLRTWSKQTVNVGTQSDIIQPNMTNLAPSGAALSTSWTINGVAWTASASSVFDPVGTTAVSNIFNNSSSLEWVPLSATYTTAGNTSGKVTAIDGAIGNVTGEWIQIESSVPLIMSSYQFATGNVTARTPKTYYIVGNNSGNTWFPIQYGAGAAVTSTTGYTTVPGIIIVNSTSTQTFGSSTITTTTYATTTNAYTRFRLIVLSTYSATNDVASLGEWFINFVPPLTSSRPSASSLSLSHTGQYQLATGPVSGSVMPNQTGLVAYNWTQAGVNWWASSSSVYLSLFAYGAFNTVNSPSGVYSWASNMGTYSATSPFACATSVSTTIQGIGATVGEWLQLQSSVPLVMQSYTYGCGGAPNIPKNYYIIGSNNGSTWFPIQLAIMTTNPFTANFQLASTYIIVNQSGTQTIVGAQTGSGSFTTYATTTNAYTYFRIVITNLYGNSTLTELGEWYINFQNSVSYSSNYGGTWLNMSSTVSNESVALSPSGQYALSTNSVIPFARLTLDNTNVDAQGILVPAAVVGTSYSSSTKVVGTHSAFFNNTASASPANYLNYTVPAVLNAPAMLTMACWAYPTSIISNVTPMALCSGTSWGNHFYINSTGVNFYWASTTSSAGTGLTSTTTAPLNTWTHICMTYTGTVLSLYVNGISVASTSVTGRLCVGNGGNLTNVLLGCGITTSNAFAGHVDDARIYTYALNADEVNGLFRNPALTQTVAVSNSYLPITSYTEPVLPGITANVVDTAVSQTGQYMVAVTSSTTNNVYYSTDFGATFTALTIGSSAMVSCSISYDGTYLTVTNATTTYTLNENTRGFALAIGNQAGRINQGLNAIAIGDKAGQTNQSNNSIVLNATGAALDAVVPGFYVAPVAMAGSSSAAPFNLLGYGTDNQIVQSSALTVLQNGNMGIGTANPTQLLDITNAASLTPAIRLQNTYSAGYVSMGSVVGVNSYVGLQATNTTTSALGTPTLVVANNGNVGIGTANPTSTLDINSNVSGYSANISIMFRNGYGSTFGFVQKAGAGSYHGITQAGDTLLLSFDQGNSVTGANGIIIASWNQTAALRIGTTTSQFNGNLGINVAAPNAPLHVIGVATSGLSGNPPMSLINSSFSSVRWDIGPNTNGDHVIFYNNNGAWLGRGNPGAGWNLQSDLRLKDEIESMTNCLDKITALRPVSYRWKYNMDSPYKSFGLIAQEAKDVIPEMVNALQDSTHGEIYGITYTTCIPILIGAVKEVSSTVVELQAVNATASSQMATLQEENAQLKSQMSSLLSWAQTQGFTL